MKRRQFLGASGLGLAATVVAPRFARAQAPVANTTAWGSMTRAARDAAYNNAAAVSGSTQIVDGWVSASATFRSQRSKHVDLAYGTFHVQIAQTAGFMAVLGIAVLIGTSRRLSVLAPAAVAAVPASLFCAAAFSAAGIAY